MKPPADDLVDRQPVWDTLQYLWMDTDPADELPYIVRVCAVSKYSASELEVIFWNEVHPALAFNLWPTISEWAGFELEWLTERILQK